MHKHTHIYKRGDFAVSQVSSLDIYLLKKVGLFPDVIERKIKQHFDKGDDISALVTGEFYTRKDHFPGFGRPFVFNAEVLLRVGRNVEAKDAVRGALKSPWWTLGCEYTSMLKTLERYQKCNYGASETNISTRDSLSDLHGVPLAPSSLLGMATFIPPSQIAA
ncbi:PREDICTED: uncharacterized protein LOC109175114 [Ipomoea nil]|uniref:uncharacterized protein LOC109175114 n=1 Tax=Ipomoea nil TaxID=35883 RepID=UPI000901EEC5|nr:PREDICTED: uncharacterized protein LOC109175114 [Ipomoea nil]